MAAPTKKTLIRRFQFSVDVSYAIEVGPEYFRFFRDGAPVVTGMDDEIYQVSTPYEEEHLRTLQFTQINDVVYITHPDLPVHKLSRFADDDWTLEEVIFNTPPLLDDNLTDITLAASATSGSSITVNASDDVFEEAHEGSFWRIGHKRDASSVNVTIDANKDGTPLPIFGEWNVRTYGVWSADILVQRRIGVGAWETVRRFEGRNDRNVDATGTAEVEAEYRLSIVNFAEATSARVIIEATDAILYGIVRITNFSSATSVQADVISNLHSTAATKIWAEGAWSEVRGYPRACTVHEQRLIFGGTFHQPSTIWGSQTEDFENFLRGSNDDESFAFTMAGVELHTIQWLVSQTDLIIGTNAGIWRVRGNDLGDPITPTRVDIKQQNNVGSEFMRGIQAAGSILYVERGGRKLRELVFSDQERHYIANDLSQFAEHLLRAGVKEMEWQGDERVLWVVNNDGLLLSLTYDREQGVVGWSAHSTAGLFDSVTTLPSLEFDTDEVWVIARRTIDNIETRYVERMGLLLNHSRKQGVYLDSSLSYEGSPVTGFAGLEHLAGMTVDCLAGGVWFEGLVVDSEGELFLPEGSDPVEIAHIGLPYTSEVQPFRLDADNTAGVHIGQVKRIDGVSARVLDSFGMSYEVEGAEHDFEVPDGIDGESPLFLFGAGIPEDLRLDFHGNHTKDPTVKLFQHKPLPFTLLALAISYVVSNP